MKQKMLILGILILSLFVSRNVYATNMSVSVSCSDVIVDSTSKCTITGKASGGSISSVHINVSVNGGASFSSFTRGSGWEGDGSGGVIDVYTDSSKSGTFTIGTVTVKGNTVGSASIVLSSIYAGDSEFNTIEGINNVTRSFKVTVKPTSKTTTTTKKTTTTTKKKTTASQKISSTNPRTEPTTASTTIRPEIVLETLTVDDFEVTKTDGIYYVTVDEKTESVEIKATAGPGISIVGLGNRTLSYGKNSVELLLKNQYAQTSLVQLIITRPELSEVKETKLSNLKIPDYPFKFSSNTYEYTLTIPYNVKEIYVIANTIDEDLIVTGDGLQELKDGNNTIRVKVLYGDIASSDYIIHIKRSYNMIIMWVIIGTLGFSLFVLVIYDYLKRQKRIKTDKNEKNKILADVNRELMEQEPKVSVNGENVLGIGRKTVLPTRVVVPTPVTNQTVLPSNNQAVQNPVNQMANQNVQSRVVEQPNQNVVVPNNQNVVLPNQQNPNIVNASSGLSNQQPLNTNPNNGIHPRQNVVNRRVNPLLEQNRVVQNNVQNNGTVLPNNINQQNINSNPTQVRVIRNSYIDSNQENNVQPQNNGIYQNEDVVVTNIENRSSGIINESNNN